MKKIAMRLLSMLIVLSMVLSAAPLTALAANENAAPAAANESFDLSAIQGVTLLKTDGVEVDEDDPSIIAVSKELDTMKVLNADGDPVPLTEEQKQQVLYMFQQYLDQWKANADVLGVQTPFFLQYNDNGEDGLGILGEMLAMSNLSVDVVRAGYVSFDDLTGMITNFYYGDQLGIQYYGSAIESVRDEILDLVEESGAMTDAQKYLVINNWLAQNVTFDMEYIMNADKDTNGDGVIDQNDDNTDPMVAQNPQKHEHYDDVYEVMYALYEAQIRAQFEGQIRAGLEAAFKNQYYTAAIEQGYYQGVYAEVEKQMTDSIYQQAYDAVYQNAYDEAYAEYIEENTHVHSYTSAVTTEPTCAVAGVMTYTCECGDSYTEEIAATGEHADSDTDEDELCDVCGTDMHEHAYTEETTTAATCTAEGVKTFTCTCGHSYTEAIPATGHTYVEEVTTAATCGTEGQKTLTCVCGDTKTEVIPATGEHVDAFEDGVCDVCEQDIPVEGEGEDNSETVNAEGDETTEDGDTTEGDDTTEEPTLEEAADAYAKEQAHAAADAAGNAAVEENADAIAQQAEATATEETDKFMTENADAIAADPVAFCETAFGAEAAAQIAAGWDLFWADAQENGVAGVNPENPEQKVKVDDIVAQQMNTPMDDLGGMTPNEAIPVFAEQAALGLTDGVLNYWQGSHFGALGRGNAVCLGYTKAFAYLVQCLKADIYTTNGNIDNAADWKTAEELYYTDGALDVTKNYAVDCIRISFNAEVTMYGETQDNFNSDHFWNAVQIDGQWYYVDPCYVDVYTEVMMRDRVETDGSVNHMYFLFSHDTAASLYEGNYSDIKTLYGTGTGMGTDLEPSASPADSTVYEDSWISRIKSNLYFDGGYAYYIYDSTDLITLMEDYENNNLEADAMTEGLLKLVRHKLTTTDAGDDGDRAYETLVEFNYKANEDDEETIARIYDPAKDKMIENVLLTKLYAQHTEDQKVYPSLAITTALYNGKLYFNMSNVLLSYNLADGDVDIVKEYNTVHGLRDDTNPFGGMAFSVVDSADKADFTVYNHPIAGIALKDDGNLYVSIATNFAFISGKDPHNSEDQSSYGYEFEESNYNPEYNSYGTSDENSDMYESFGYTKEINDNDEFMWSANFVETLSMSHLAGTRHSYEEVSIEATCGRNAFTENRCTTCGASEDDTRVEVEETATAHHYVYFEEEFYTINEDTNNWNTGSCYVCTECGFHIAKPTEPTQSSMVSDEDYQKQVEQYEKELAIYEDAVATAGHTYEPTDVVWAEDNSSVTFSELQCSAICPERQPHLDCLLQDDTITLTLENEVKMDASVVDTTGTCPEGVTQVYQASGEVELEIIEDKPETFAYTATKYVTLDPTECKFEGGFCSVCGNCTVHRVSGASRYETSLASADALKETLGVESFDTIIVASGNNFADALTGSYLATVKSAPILLHANSVQDANIAYISENLTEGGTVYILGGVNSVSADLETALTDLGITVERLAGATRFETNLAILEEAGVADEEILVCTAYNFADSLSASATGLPMLLVDNKGLTEDQAAFLAELKGNDITVIGGVNSVSEAIETALGEYSENVTRIAGATREDTSIAVAEKYFEDPDFIVLAYSRNYPDGLCGGPLAYTLKAPLVLTNAGAEAVAVEYAAANKVTHGLILGGVNSVSDATAKQIFAITGDAEIPAL